MLNFFIDIHMQTHAGTTSVIVIGGNSLDVIGQLWRNVMVSEMKTCDWQALIHSNCLLNVDDIL